jgi:SAM-dependent methyltransferase
MMCVDAARCLRAYSRAKVVAYYAGYVALEKPEQAVLHALAERLASLRMLDIGVGGGRMTEHFAPRVREYTGIDISPAMIDACRKRFAGRIPADRFAVRDMRELERYPAHAFELVLNSYNTIDHLDPLERERFIAEVRRITAPGGYFCFSTHNIRSLARREPIEWFWHRPHATLRALLHRAHYLKLNRGALERHAHADHVIINNGTHYDFALELYYVRPEAQLEALERAGFDHVRVYSLVTGEELTGEKITSATDRWLYYLCS